LAAVRPSLSLLNWRTWGQERGRLGGTFCVIRQNGSSVKKKENKGRGPKEVLLARFLFWARKILGGGKGKYYGESGPGWGVKGVKKGSRLYKV